MRSRASRSLCYVLITALVATIAPLPLAKRASAQLMPQYSVVVTDFINESGVQGALLSRLATDAVVVEMGKTNRYDVSITRSQIQKEMDDLGVHPPLTKIGLVRLGERLSADAMLEGSIKSVQLAGSAVTRRASVTIVMQMVDQASGEIINGAVQTGNSSARVGYSADDDSLITEAINNAAFLAVRTMVDYIIPEATVMMNIKGSQVMLNKGLRDGLKPGMRMIVLRQKEIIGYVEVQNVSPTDSYANVIKSMRGIQPEDKVRAIFDMPTVTSTLKSEPMPSGAPKSSGGQTGSMSKIAKALIGLGVVFGLVTLFRGGRGAEDAPPISVGTSATTITWNPNKYGNGANVLEYQVLRLDAPGDLGPVRSVRNPSMVDLGWTNLYNIYGPVAPNGTAVAYWRIDQNPSTSAPVESTWTVPYEPYGQTHQYQVRVLYKQGSATSSSSTGTTGGTTGTTSGSTRYFYTPLSDTMITATAIDPVKNADVVSPAYDPGQAAPELLISDLQSGAVNFQWNRKDGADEYRVVVEPIEAGKAPSYTSDKFPELGPIVSLPSSMRSQLATLLANSKYAGVIMKWRVDCRHSADTATIQYPDSSWWQGQENRFAIGSTPPNLP